MRKFLSIIIIMFLANVVNAEGFEQIPAVNPLMPQPMSANTIALPVKKATLTHNNIHNLYVLAFERFIQSNVKSAYNDFKIMIDSIGENDYVYMKFAENMADIGFFDLSEKAAGKIQDKSLSGFLVDDIKLYYFPIKKLKVDDEIYLSEVFSNIIYNDQSKEATDELIKNTMLMSNSDYANYVAALGFLKSNNFIDASKYIDNAIKMNPQNLNYKKLKAEILAQGKKPQNAIKLVQSIKSEKIYSEDFIRKVNSLEQYVLYKSKKNYSEKMYHLGYYYYYENELTKSIRTLQGALSNKKKLNKDIYALLSRVYFDSQDFEKAQDAATKSCKISKNTTSLIVLGDLSYRTKEYKNALKYYKLAESCDKNSSAPKIRIAQVYEQTGKNKKALDIYEKMLKNYDDCYIAYYKVALSDKSKEIAYLKKAIAINMNFAEAWIDLGRVAYEQKKYTDAKNYLRIANYIDDNNFRSYYYQGLIAKKQGVESTLYFKKSLSINPNFELAQKELGI